MVKAKVQRKRIKYYTILTTVFPTVTGTLGTGLLITAQVFRALSAVGEG